MSRALVVGGGLFGLPAALALRERGLEVTLVDGAALPNPLAAATDVSKAVRADYMDPVYVALGKEALAGWDRWNAESPRPYFHRTGAWFLSSDEPGPERFESVGRRLVEEHGLDAHPVTPERLAAEFPAVDRTVFRHGYLSPDAGWAESGTAMAWLAERARAAGVEIHQEWRAAELVRDGDRVTGVRATDGRTESADHVVLAAGAWTPALLPELADRLRVTGQPIVFFRPADPATFRAPGFAVWTADIEATGWYGFPALPDGRLKIANHGAGRPIGPDDDRVVTPEEISACRAFAERLFPALRGAPVVETRLCLYCNTPTTGLLIDRHPGLAGLTVATGGTGHAFKFAPVVGDLVADAVLGVSHRYGDAFSWNAALGGSA